MLSILLFLLVAESSVAREFNFTGFATMGVTRGDSRDTAYLTTIDHEASTSRVSRIGMLFDSNIKENVTAKLMLLGLAKDEDFAMRAKLAQINFDISDSLQVRFGRMRLPIWMMSEIIDIGVLFPWTRLPVEIYGFAGLDSYIGSSVIWRKPVWGLFFEVETYIGGGEFIIPPGAVRSKIDIKDTGGVQFGVRGNHWTYRLSFMQGNADSEYSVGGGQATASFRLLRFYSTGIRYETKRWLGISEISSFTTEHPERGFFESYYATLGYKWSDGKLTPHLTYSKLSREDMQLVIGTQNTVSLGLNWKIDHDISAKFDLSRVALENPEARSFFSNTNDKEIHIADVSINFLF